MTFQWPATFLRVIDEEWTQQPVESLALKYDTVENHGWYANLDTVVERVADFLQDGRILIDYSGGTGIFLERLVRKIGLRPVGAVIVDASAKFLRLSLEKFRADPRVAFRLIRYLKDQKRLEYVDEVLNLQADALASTNAIHLYFDLADTLRSWRRILKPGARVFINSGNIRNPGALPGEWIIDETVESIHRIASELVDASHRTILDQPERMKEYDVLRRKYFLPVRPLKHYVRALSEAGFQSISVTQQTIPAKVSEWFDFLSVYHDGVLGWVGGVDKIEGQPPTEESVRYRLDLMRRAMDTLFEGKSTFPCCWTYITCESPG